MINRHKTAQTLTPETAHLLLSEKLFSEPAVHDMFSAPPQERIGMPTYSEMKDKMGANRDQTTETRGVRPSQGLDSAGRQ